MITSSPYQPVDSSRGQIRILILHPASKHNAEITCELQSTYLSSNPLYEALSYSWGSVGEASCIRLNNHSLQVWENAAAALRALRFPRKKRRLWIDAICINQDDLAERATQVLLMQQIYGQAQQVCVWLGELTDGGTVGMKQLQNKMLAVGWHQRKFDKAHGYPTLSFSENINNRAGIMNRANLVEEQMNGEVREILDRPWWRRTWIIQEAVLAKKMVIMCGSETTTWDSIHELSKRLRWTQGRLEVFGLQQNEKDFFPDEIYRIISDYRQKWHSKAHINLYDVLYRFRLLDCTDARDRIYGFLGIIPSVARMGIVPDYQSTVAMVYWQFARKVIQATESLEMLNCKREWAGIKTKDRTVKAYSVLDQSRYYDVHALISDGPDRKTRRSWARLPSGWERITSGKASFYQDHINAQLHEISPLEGQPPRLSEYHTMQRSLPPGWSKKWDNLGVAAVIYGVEETPYETSLRLKRDALAEELYRLPSWVPNWAFPTHWDPAPLIDWTLSERQYSASGDTTPYLHSPADSHLLSLDGLIVDRIQYLASPWHPESETPPLSRKGIEELVDWEVLGAVEVENCPYKSTGGRVAALWRTMIGDYAGDQAAPEEDWAYVETWYDRVGWNKELPNLASKTPYENAALESDISGLESEMVEHFFQLKPPPALGFREAFSFAFTEPFRVKKSYETYMKRIHKACAHRALFVTTKGYIGLAPWNASEGDEVAIMYGGRTPYLLRRSSAFGQLSLVGETYVYGLMAGEALSGDVAQQRGSQVLHIS